MKGLIFSVKRYSIHDGPGIRVTFFMKGCPMKCCWCHNPEGISPLPENGERVDKIGERVFGRNEVAGKFCQVDDILYILEKEKIFFSESKGGVTFSGGEPMFQYEFLLEALKACKYNGYHTAVDTSGYSQSDNYKAIIPFTDLFLFDIKQLDDEKHIRYTGVSNSLILNNFQLIINSGKDIIARIPVIPGLNDDQAHLERLKAFLTESSEKNLKMITLLPYHKIGVSKYERFCIPYMMHDIPQPSSSRMNELKEFFAETGIKIKIGG